MKSSEPNYPFDNYVLANIDTMLANMCGEADRVPDLQHAFEVDTGDTDRQGRAIYTRHLPCGNIPLRRSMMRAYNWMSENGIQPTRQNLLSTLTDIMGLTRDEALEKTVDRILEKATPKRNVWVQAVYLHNRIRQLEVNQVEEEVKKLLVDAPAYELDRRLNQSVTLLTDAMGETQEEAPQRTMSELAEWYHKEVIPERQKFRESGKGYPTLKFRDFTTGIPGNGTVRRQPLVPYLKWGDSTLISGVTGTGKTTLGQVIAEHNAWVEGHDVLYIHLETPQDEMMDRSIARHAQIPMDYLENQYCGSNDPMFERISAYLTWVGTNPKPSPGGQTIDAGELIYKYCPGWNIFRINALIRVMRLRADTRQRGLLVMLDYYDIIPRTEFGTTDAYARGHVIRLLRDGIKRENLKASVGVHCIVMAQENESCPGQPYGSKEIKHYIQLMISIQRQPELVTYDHEVQVNGEVARDALGNPRYYHRTGNYDSTLTLKIIKSNKSGRGAVRIRQEAAFFRLEDLPVGEVMSNSTGRNGD